jgi:hypothetical protein
MIFDKPNLVGEEFFQVINNLIFLFLKKFWHQKQTFLRVVMLVKKRKRVDEIACIF